MEKNSNQLRLALQRLGAASPLVLWAAFTACIAVLMVMGTMVEGNVPGETVVNILAVFVFGLLFVTITWFRSDDWLAAGVLLTLVVYATFAMQMLLLILLHGDIGPAALLGAVTVGGAIIYAIILAPIAGGLIALARWLTRESARISLPRISKRS